MCEWMSNIYIYIDQTSIHVVLVTLLRIIYVYTLFKEPKPPYTQDPYPYMHFLRGQTSIYDVLVETHLHIQNIYTTDTGSYIRDQFEDESRTRGNFQLSFQGRIFV